MGAAIIAQMIDYLWRSGQLRQAGRVLTVEDPQRVKSQALAAILTEAIGHPAQRLPQLCRIGRPALVVAHTAEFQLIVNDADGPQIVDRRDDRLGVDRRLPPSHRFHTYLPELA